MDLGQRLRVSASTAGLTVRLPRGGFATEQPFCVRYVDDGG